MTTTSGGDGSSGNKVSSICSECGARLTFELGAPQVKCDHCDAGLAVEKGAKLLRLGCPRCGGNFYYIDGSLCGHCPYCDAGLMALCQDRVLRLVVRPQAERPAEAGEGAALKLLPFWHLGGLVFSWCVGSKVEIVDDKPASSQEAENVDVRQTIRRDSGPMKAFAGRVLDLSIPDPATLAHGVTSLRLRGAVFPVEPFAEEHEQLGEVVPATIDHRVARDRLFSRALTLTSKEGMTRVDLRRFDVTAERLSLLYYPFWVDVQEGSQRAWDAVSGEPEVLSPGEQPEHRAAPLFDNLQLVELTCQACGHELPAGNHAMILPCRGCGAFWQVTAEGLRPFQARYARPHLQAERRVWLPFWQLPVSVSYSGQRAQVAGELITSLGVLRPPSEAPQSPPNSQLCYFAPAYGAMRAPRVDHAARDMTRHQPLLEPGERPDDGELYNCFFSPEDARRLAYATMILIMPGTIPRKLRSLRVIHAGDPTLWYVPFEDAGRELVNLLTGVRYDRTAFRGVRH